LALDHLTATIEQVVMPTRIGTREEWLVARTMLLEAEKELTRRSDEVTRERQLLPVPIAKDYRFETTERHGLAPRPVPRALPAARASLHVSRMPELLVRRGRVHGSPCTSRIMTSR
jgi:Bacterial protein of unknown function (DUF899)